MGSVLVVVGSGIILSWVVPSVLVRLRRLDARPRLAIGLWLATSLGAVGALGLAGLLLVLPADPFGQGVAGLLRTCVMALRQALDAPPAALGVPVGLGLLALVAGGLVAGVAVTARRARQDTRRHQELLTLAGESTPGLPGVVLLEHPAPLAYCLPGRTGPIVVSHTTTARLDPAQLAAVLAHERAHQAGGHHLLIGLAAALQAGFGFLPATRLAVVAVSQLVELAADDAAARAAGRDQVAAALRVLGTTTVPGGALAAAGMMALERIVRLTQPPARPGVRLPLVGGLLVVVPLAVQLLALAAPLAQAAGTPVCPLT